MERMKEHLFSIVQNIVEKGEITKSTFQTLMDKNGTSGNQ